MKLRPILLLSVLSLLIHPSLAGAQWALDGNALCTETGSQIGAVAVSDDAGGAIVAWADSRSGNYDIYVQRVDAWGAVKWTLDGLGVRVATSSQANPAIASNGLGGAIIFWEHLANNGSTDIYAQGVNSLGVIQWPSAGLLVCGAQHDQFSPRAVADGYGGAIVVWQDNRQGSFIVTDVYMQRVHSLGGVHFQTDGVPVCTAANAQAYARLVGDGTGGAIFAWSDARDGTTYRVYAQHVPYTGIPEWTADGVLLGADTGAGDPPTITTDGSGGAIVAWQSDIGGDDIDIYAQRLHPSGVAMWTPGGVLVCAADYHQTQPQITPDGAGGSIVTWLDIRDSGVQFEEDIYAQRMNASGVALWTPDGVALCTEDGGGISPQLVSDGVGGAVVSWIDTRNSEYDIFARRINSAGTALWTPDGVPVCQAADNQLSPAIVTDEFGGAIVAWTDYRSGTPDVYANRVTGGGAIPTAAGESPAIPSIVVNNYPNPFSNATVIEITLDHESDVNVDVFDVAGRRVRAINVGRVGAGVRLVNFDGRNQRGKLLPSGLYFCRIQAGSATVTHKMVIQR